MTRYARASAGSSRFGWAGFAALVTFAFGHCRTLCPAIVHQARAARLELDGDWAIVVLTLDPWRDTRERDELTGDITHPGIVYMVDEEGTVAYQSIDGRRAAAPQPGAKGRVGGRRVGEDHWERGSRARGRPVSV